MERCVHKHLYNYLIENNLLTSSQSGFIRGDSTVNQLTFLYNDISRALDQGKEVRAVFCDISKAFDRVWHRGLLSKLQSIGITDSLLDWFSSYLSSRKQRVVYANSSSQWSCIKAGVPQGSILGPLLFLIYINDIVNSINSNIRLFADDTSLYITVDNPSSSAALLNTYLKTIHSWSQKWLVSFNPAKTESMIFSRKQSKIAHPPIYMNNIAINQVQTHTHLGLTFSADAKWTTHINKSINNAWRRIGLLRSLKFILSRSSLERMYFSFIRPLLEYGDVIWDNCSVGLKNDLEAVQNEAARIVAGATKLCNIKNLLRELNWDTLEARRKKHRLILFFKMYHHMTPSYISDLIPSKSQTTHFLRSTGDVPSINSRTQSYNSSFLPATIHDWNNLPFQTRNSTTISSFKRALETNLIKSNPLYKLGTRKGQILHTRLRLGCSSLNFDLHRKSISDSPLCRCGSVETASHYLLYCPLYQQLRTQLLSDIPCPPLVDSLLYGDEHLSFQQNKQLFILVQRFIVASKRFSS